MVSIGCWVSITLNSVSQFQRVWTLGECTVCTCMPPSYLFIQYQCMHLAVCVRGSPHSGHMQAKGGVCLYWYMCGYVIHSIGTCMCDHMTVPLAWEVVEASWIYYSTFHSQISGLGHSSGEIETCHETGGKVRVSAVEIY